jgi:hypothetical protein
MIKVFGSILALTLLVLSAVYFFLRPEAKVISDRRLIVNRVRSVYRNTTGYVQRLFAVKRPQDPEIIRAAAA